MIGRPKCQFCYLFYFSS